ncbi:MAG: GIY-YIG nuclease family protein [Rhodospirillales bacterium]|nr:GIY-YIG nuclease family protein [Rhodospirillales bacterium]
MKEWFVYIVRNPNDILYTGIAKDTTRRIDAHNKGCGARFTRGRGPWKMAHSEGPFDHGDALRREIEIKNDTTFKREIKSQFID